MDSSLEDCNKETAEPSEPEQALTNPEYLRLDHTESDQTWLDSLFADCSSNDFDFLNEDFTALDVPGAGSTTAENANIYAPIPPSGEGVQIDASQIYPGELQPGPVPGSSLDSYEFIDFEPSVVVPTIPQTPAVSLPHVAFNFPATDGTPTYADSLGVSASLSAIQAYPSPAPFTPPILHHTQPGPYNHRPSFASAPSPALPPQTTTRPQLQPPPPHRPGPQRRHPRMNSSGITTKHNWVYGAASFPNSQRDRGPKDALRHYRPTFCCSCERVNRGWYSKERDGRKRCVDCGHKYGDDELTREAPECCNPEVRRAGEGLGAGTGSVDDWWGPWFEEEEVRPMTREGLEVYD